ncbi:hypothetical protein ZHAWSFBX_CDS_0063 [Agrobacterium phage Alfirin]|nr:hypothetical protein ZHAWSFBX_CDS_0063 [Agrobacterium phage Alfirin]
MTILISDEGFDWDAVTYDLSHDELIWIIGKLAPTLVHGTDFICAHRLGADGERDSTAVMLSWTSTLDLPTVTDVLAACETYAADLSEFRVRAQRVTTYVPLSPRQLWLAALSFDITKETVLAKVQTIADPVLRTKYTIALSEPPVQGYIRDSASVEYMRELMGFTSAEFDDMWLWAQEI